jgi:hypothetical protein
VIFDVIQSCLALVSRQQAWTYRQLLLILLLLLLLLMALL